VFDFRFSFPPVWRKKKNSKASPKGEKPVKTFEFLTLVWRTYMYLLAFRENVYKKRSKKVEINAKHFITNTKLLVNWILKYWCNSFFSKRFIGIFATQNSKKRPTG
jgi:hypothetical protein